MTTMDVISLDHFLIPSIFYHFNFFYFTSSRFNGSVNDAVMKGMESHGLFVN